MAVEVQPVTTQSDTSAFSMFMITILIIGLVALFLYFVGIPMVNNNGGATTQQSPQINIPDKVNVDVNKTN